MGTISDKLTYLNTTKGLIKDTINLTGANITNDTFRSYAHKLKLGYLDILNNGIDTLYNNFPKVSGIGSNLSLTPTYKAPIKLNEIQGNTSQNGSPTPSSPVPIQSVTGLQNVTISNSDNTESNTYEVNLGKNLLPNTNTTQVLNNITFTKNDDDSFKMNGTANANTSYRINTLGNELSLPAGTYTISTGNNLTSGITLQGWHSTATNFVTIQSSSNKASFTLTSDVSNVRFQIVIANGTQISNLTIYPMLEKGSQATSYSEYFTPIELNDEGSIKKSNGKNLFDKNTIIEGKYIDSNGNLSDDNNNFVGDYIEIDNTKSYYASQNAGGVIRIGYYNSSKTYISRQLINGNYGSLTIPNNTKYVRLSCYNTSLGTLQLEQNSQATDYEPYGKVWYITKNIQNWSTNSPNVFLINGSDGNAQSSPDGLFQIFTSNLFTNFKNEEMLSSKFKYHYDSRIDGNVNANTYLTDNTFCIRQGTNDRVYFKSSDLANKSKADVLSTLNGLDLSYVLSTPIYEVITNTELIEQLETLNNAKSEDGTTNINVTSEDLAMILNVSVIKGDA